MTVAIKCIEYMRIVYNKDNKITSGDKEDNGCRDSSYDDVDP